MMDVMQTNRLRHVWVWVILPLFVYLLVAWLMTWPLARHLGKHAAGVGPGDTYMMLRQGWEAKEQLLDGENPLHQARVAYPDGITSHVMWSTPLRWVPVMLLSFVVPPVAAYNIWILATITLNGLTAYWLGMDLTRRHIAASLLGGLVFTAFPSIQGHVSVGHIDVMAMYGFPLFALYWWRALFRSVDVDRMDVLRDPSATVSWRGVVWGAVWFAVASLGLTSQIIYALMPLVLFSGLYVLLGQREHIMPGDRVWTTWPLTRAAAMVLLGGAILLVFFGPLLTPTGLAEIRALEDKGRVLFSTDLLAFVSPSPLGPFDELGVVPQYARDVVGTSTAEGAAYLGIVASLLALVALVARRAARPWLAVALGAMLLSLGPLLKVHQELVQIHFELFESYIVLPWGILQDLPVLEDTRTTGRFNNATALAWGALASLGAAAVLRRIGRQGVVRGLALLLGAVIMFEYQLFWPFPTGSADQPDYFENLAAREDVDAVYNVPAQLSIAQMQAMAQQMVHEKPMIAGMLYRLSPQDPALLAVLDRALLGGERRIDGSDMLQETSPDVIPALLRETGADLVILHKQFVVDAEGAVERLHRVLGPPEYEDSHTVVFAVPDDPAPIDPAPVIAGSRVGWSDPVALDAFTGAFMGEKAAWQFYTSGQIHGTLTFPAQGYTLSRKIAVRLDGELLAGIWAEPDANELHVPLWTDAGFHSLEFEALAGCTPYHFALGCLGDGDCSRNTLPACISAAFGVPMWQAAESAVTTLDVAFVHDLRLRGYDVQVTDDPRALHVRLFWDAENTLPESYALFVHLTRPDDATPLAQYADYPAIATDAWDGGAVWTSDVLVPLGDDVPPGEYAINVGWFDPASSARLGVEGDAPLADANIVRLTTVAVE